MTDQDLIDLVKKMEFDAEASGCDADLENMDEILSRMRMCKHQEKKHQEILERMVKCLMKCHQR